MRVARLSRDRARLNCYCAEFFPVAPDKPPPHDHRGVAFIYTH